MFTVYSELQEDNIETNKNLNIDSNSKKEIKRKELNTPFKMNRPTKQDVKVKVIEKSAASGAIFVGLLGGVAGAVIGGVFGAISYVPIAVFQAYEKFLMGGEEPRPQNKVTQTNQKINKPNKTSKLVNK